MLASNCGPADASDTNLAVLLQNLQDVRLARELSADTPIDPAVEHCSIYPQMSLCSLLPGEMSGPCEPINLQSIRQQLVPQDSQKPLRDSFTIRLNENS